MSDTPTVVSILWSDFTGGSPEASVASPSDITHVVWTFPWSSGAASYAVDIRIDELSFIP